ncbi:MAG: MATE family efflux transporter, partial [Pseudomonadota bacterium]|nr:MATE family efflux transporter [Pseudomonadota bacterium]
MTATADARQGQSWQQQASWRHIWAISWPVLLANITFPLVGAADTAMMGRLEDASFVGGVALGSLVFNFIYFGLGFLRMGTTGLVAQAHGRGDATAIEHHLVRGLVLAFCLGTGFVLAKPLLLVLTGVLLAASPAVEALMQQYVGIRMLAVPAAFANMVLLGCLFGRQHMRLVLVQIIFINVTNLALNILFVLGLGMAIEGVALASVAAQWTGLVLTLVLIRWQWRGLLAGIARRVFRFRPAWFDPTAFRRFFVIGGDIMIRTVLILLSEAVLLNNAATIGDLSLATAQLVLVMFSLISFGLDGYAHAAEALVGEAIGRRNLPMLDQVVRRTNILAGISALVISILAWAGGPLII